MRTLRIGTLLSLAVGMALTACNRTEQVSPTANDTALEPLQEPKDAAFSMEAHAIKSREKDPAKIQSALRELTSRYGYPALSQELSSSNQGSNAAPSALGKIATQHWPHVRSVNVIYHFAHSRTVSVAANATLKVWGIQEDGGTDPMVMGFYKNDDSPYPTAYLVDFVGYNDDMAEGNLNSYFKWKNTTGSAKTVRIVSWCYPPLAGTTSMSYTVTRPGYLTKSGFSTMWVSGNTEFYTNALPDYEACTGPTTSRVALYRNPSNPATGFGSTLVAFNQATMRGAFIQDTDNSRVLDEPLPQAGSNFLLGYFEGDGYQPSPMDESAASLQKLDAHYGYPFYFATQQDRYLCP